MKKTLIAVFIFIVFSMTQSHSQDVSIAAADRSTEQAALRSQLLQQFNSILETQDTARGLVINISNSLFQLKGPKLVPPALEKLSKIAVIVSSHPDLELEIEGHATGTGDNNSNKLLSGEIAQSIKKYLVSQGLPADKISSQGIGETEPADLLNDPSQVRQLNRWAEIFVSGETIGGMMAEAK